MMKRTGTVPRFTTLLATVLLLAGTASLWGQTAGQEDTTHSLSGRRHRFVVKNLGRGYIGVSVLGLTPELRRHYGVAEDTGVLVARVEPSGPAEAAGVQVGDILTGVNGELVESARGLSRAVSGKEQGEQVNLELYRDGALQSVTVDVAAREGHAMGFGNYMFVPDMPDVGAVVGAWDGADFNFTMPNLELDEDAVRAMEDAMQKLGEQYQSAEWQEKLKRLEELDFSEIQERMREVEERLRGLEVELAEAEESKKKRF